MRRFQIFLIFAIILFVGTTIAADLYPINSPVHKLNGSNFAKRITNNRKKVISVVHFYKPNDGYSSRLKDEYEQYTKDNKGMFELWEINCEAFLDVCKKEGITDFPVFRIYPPFPAPIVDFDKDSYTLNKLKKKAASFIESKVIEINSGNIDSFLADNPGKPKALLFTKSEDVPVLYKALSYNFDKTLFFGIVRESETTIAKKYKIKSFPTILLIKPNESPRKYEGEIKYYDIANFINVYSEIFDFGDNAKQESNTVITKSWLNEKIPELHKDSADDIWYSKKGLWVVLFSNEKPSEDIINTLISVRDKFTSNLDDRGLQFSFMWIDVAKNNEWSGYFELEKLPQIVVINPGKTKKFIVHHSDLITDSSVSTVLNSITGGDAKFKKVQNNALPLLK